MSDKIQETQDKLKKLGYFASKDLSKIITLFEASGKRNSKSIPTLLLEGNSGAGKTFLAETFSKMINADEKFVQCFPRMGSENFQYDVNIEGVMKQDAENSIKQGILLQTLNQSKKGPVVLVIDELDKARPEVDSFLLDFLENGRLTTGTDTFEKGKYPIYTIITSNDKREIDDALINRSKKVEVPRPEKDLFLEILGLPEDHYIGYIYDKCPNFSIRQARQYIDDLQILGTEIDEEALSQYINLDDLDVMSLADIQDLNKVEDGAIEVELPDLERCSIKITSKNKEGWAKIFENKPKSNFTIYTDEQYHDYYVNIDTLDQLQDVTKYVDLDSYYDGYSGWFEYSMPDSDIQSDNIIWAENKNEKDGTRFGIKINNGNLFKIAMNRGTTFVYLHSDSSNSLEAFLENENVNDEKTEQDYGTDDEYIDNDNSRDD